jgi:hypothetical protein
MSTLKTAGAAAMLALAAPAFGQRPSVAVYLINIGVPESGPQRRERATAAPVRLRVYSWPRPVLSHDSESSSPVRAEAEDGKGAVEGGCVLDSEPAHNCESRPIDYGEILVTEGKPDLPRRCRGASRNAACRPGGKSPFCGVSCSRPPSNGQDHPGRRADGSSCTAVCETPRRACTGQVGGGVGGRHLHRNRTGVDGREMAAALS